MHVNNSNTGPRTSPSPMRRTLQWRHNGHSSVSNHQPHDCLLNRLFRCRSKKTSKLRVTGFCAGNLPGTGEFPAQMASNAENVSIWWRHHGSVWKDELDNNKETNGLPTRSDVTWYICHVVWLMHQYCHSQDGVVTAEGLVSVGARAAATTILT